MSSINVLVANARLVFYSLFLATENPFVSSGGISIYIIEVI